MRMFISFFVLVLIAIFSGCVDEQQSVGGDKLGVLFKADFENDSLDGWQQSDPKAWKIQSSYQVRVLSLFQQSDYKPAVRSPLSYCLYKKDVDGSFVMKVRMLSTVRDYAHRDLCLFFGYQGPTKFYYVHIANTADPNANSIFIVNDEPRVAIAKTTNHGNGWDSNWHDVKIVRDAKAGLIEVYYDDIEEPIMTAEDKTFIWGKVGVGSFDDLGHFDDIIVWGKGK